MTIRIRTLLIAGLACGAVSLSSPQSQAQPVLDACATDIATYCSQVTPGDGRLLACFYAHEDKISDACDQAVAEAADQLDWFFSRLRIAAELCASDIEKHCAQTPAGDGRIYACLNGKRDALDRDCGLVVDRVTERLAE